MSIFKDALMYIHNRWVHPSHKVIITDPEFGIGSYHDIDHRMLYANFQLLVDYVEIECAALNGDHFNTPVQKVLDTLHNIPILHWFLPSYRNALQGLHRLRWEIGLGDEHPSQSASAQVIFDLYKFWKHDRPCRIDPWDMVPDVDFSAMIKYAKDHNGTLPELDPFTKSCYNFAHELEDKYFQEDTEMLQLLIKYRNHLWT